jgi:hypothetical protein
MLCLLVGESDRTTTRGQVFAIEHLMGTPKRRSIIGRRPTARWLQSQTQFGQPTRAIEPNGNHHAL